MRTIALRITVFIVLIFLVPGILRAQDFLNKSKEEIQHLAIRMSTESEATYQERGDTLTLYCQEQDDIGRFFDISYTFIFQHGKCAYYEKCLPAHDFWITHLIDQIEMQGGKGRNEVYDIEGSYLYPIYDFEKYRLYTRIDKDMLCCTFTTNI